MRGLGVPDMYWTGEVPPGAGGVVPGSLPASSSSRLPAHQLLSAEERQERQDTSHNEILKVEFDRYGEQLFDALGELERLIKVYSEAGQVVNSML